jgi:hypothetical protein
MKYFTFELLCAANDWIEQSDEERLAAEQRFERASQEYLRGLDALRPRISKPAWEFFRYGGNETGIHDATLLSASAGDGLNYAAEGSSPFLVNRGKMAARIEFLNFEQDRHYTFKLQGVSHYAADLYVEQHRAAKSIGDLYLCELSAASDDELQLGFLFASGASIVTRFKRLVFKNRRIPRKYEIGERFRK